MKFVVEIKNYVLHELREEKKSVKFVVYLTKSVYLCNIF